MTGFTYDDEDRLTSLTPPGASSPLDTFTYNGLGLRVGKTDSTGTYSYFCDGASAGSPVLSDGHAVYTPGLSENRGGVSTYAASDVLGNLWFLDGAGSGTPQTYYQDTTAFGSGQGMGIGGTSASPFKFGGGNGCQSDVDTGLVLMGHRYYDTRIGRFISQDPAGSGDNWYAYADNDPVDEVDPNGLDAVISLPIGSTPMGSPGYMDSAASASAGAYDYYKQSQGYWTRGEPTGINIHEQLSNSGGEVETRWIGSNDFNVSFNPFDLEDALTHDMYERFRKVADDQIRFHAENILIATGMVKLNYAGIDPEKTVKEILKKKKASIKQAPLESGSPSWQDIQNQKWKDIVGGAAGREPGYDTFRKLLTDGRFNK